MVLAEMMQSVFDVLSVRRDVARDVDSLDLSIDFIAGNGLIEIEAVLHVDEYLLAAFFEPFHEDLQVPNGNGIESCQDHTVPRVGVGGLDRLAHARFDIVVKDEVVCEKVPAAQLVDGQKVVLHIQL